MNKESADQTGHLYRLVCTFVVRKQNQISRGEPHIQN